MWWRMFVVDAKDNSNVRIFDFGADDQAAARGIADAELKKGEAVDQLVELAEGPAG
jgi:hypothetical protein